jgi:hypothetical protein
MTCHEIRPWQLVCLFVGLGACSDVLPKPGQYECGDDADCPSGWVCHTDGDGLCYENETQFPDTTDTDSREQETGSHSENTDMETSSESLTSLDTDTVDTSASTDTGTHADTGTGGSDDECLFSAASFDFEDGKQGFTHGSTLPLGQDPWTRGDWLGSCASGAQCFVTAPGEKYAPCTSAELVSPVFDLGGCFDSTVRLVFSHIYDIEPINKGQYRDGALVQVSGDGGVSWIDVSPTPAYTGLIEGDYGDICGNTPSQAEGREAWSGGNLEKWVEVNVTVPLGVVTEAFRFRFVLSSDREKERLGWAVDDISLLVEP